MHGVTVASRTMTADELLRMPDDSHRYALVDGELKRMTPEFSSDSGQDQRSR